jgi:hypothetical protein
LAGNHPFAGSTLTTWYRCAEIIESRRQFDINYELRGFPDLPQPKAGWGRWGIPVVGSSGGQCVIRLAGCSGLERETGRYGLERLAA